MPFGLAPNCWGRGPDAELAASEMKQEGELYVLVPKPPGIRRLPPVRPEPDQVAGRRARDLSSESAGDPGMEASATF